MENTTILIGYVILLLVAVALIIIAFLVKGTWLLNRAEVKVDRIGVDISVENRVLVVIMGIVVLGFAGFFMHQHDQDAYEKYKSAEERFNLTTARLDELLLEKYDLELNLDFEGVTSDFLKSEEGFFHSVSFVVTSTPYLGEPFELDQEMLERAQKGFRIDRQTQGLLLNVQGMRKDDKFSILATYDNYTWWASTVASHG